MNNLKNGLSYDEVVVQLLERTPDKNYHLAKINKPHRVFEILELLGNPQDSFQSIHITGTNGKSSTARIAQALILSHGISCGRYSSPHLYRVNERININGKDIEDRDFVSVYSEIIEVVEDYEEEHLDEPPLAFFEVLTIMALQIFAKTSVEFAVIEVGMGAINDATNVLEPAVSVITNVDLDHQDYLGQSAEAIAIQKAAIMHPEIPVIVGQSDSFEIDLLLSSLAEEEGAKLVLEGRDIFVHDVETAVGGEVVSLETTRGVYDELALSLFGEFQTHNALLALAAVEEVLSPDDTDRSPLNPEVVAEAFQIVSVPGRFEQIASNPVTILDVAHNPAGARALLRSMDIREDITRWVLVIAMLKDKDVEGFLNELEGQFIKVFVASSPSERAMSAEELSKITAEYFDDVEMASSLNSAVAAARVFADGVNKGAELDDSCGVLVAGSVRNAAKIDLARERAERLVIESEEDLEGEEYSEELDEDEDFEEFR